MFQRAARAEQSNSVAQFPLFDWLRFVLASVVALNHEGVIRWGYAGNFAVQIFFALSGWLIGGILLSTDRGHLPRFYYNRATRIWIPYALAMAFFYAVAAVHEGIDHSFIRCLLFDVTFTHNWFIDPANPMPLHGTGNHFWSIAVEEQFYLAAPILIVLSPYGRSAAFWAFISAVAVLSGSWYGSISLGVLAAVLRPRIPLSILAAGCVCAATAMLTIDYTIFSPVVAVSIILLTSLEGQRSQIGEFLGGVSYPFYLYHWIGMFAANAIGNKFGFSAGRGEIAYVIAIASGIGAYLAVDRNVMRFRKRFYSPKTGKILMATAYALMLIGVAFGCLQLI